MSTNRIIRIVTSISLIIAVAAAPATIQAGRFGVQSCSQAYVIIWEHYGYNGRGLQICYGTNIPDLGVYGFDNITSAAQFRELSLNTSVCLYSELNYIGQVWKATSNADEHWIFPPNDWTTSVKFGC